jgi:hypothetical protein
MKKVKKIFKNTIALVVLKVSGVLAAGSLGGIELWQSALIASFVGIMEVAEELSRSYLKDGELSDKDIQSAYVQDGQ